MNVKYVFGELINHLEQWRQKDGYPPHILWPRIRDEFHIEIIAQGTTGIVHDLPVAIIDIGATVISISRVEENLSLLENDLISQNLLYIDKYLPDISHRFEKGLVHLEKKPITSKTLQEDRILMPELLTLPPLYSDMKEDVRKLSLLPLKVTAIAYRLGISESTVKRYRKELGLQRKK
jgi:hypothetical protein